MGQLPTTLDMRNSAEYRDVHRDLVLGCCRGERQAQFALYQHYAKGMYNVCLRMLRNPHDAEDVMQVAFVDIFGKIETFKFDSSIGAWIKRIVVNRCIDHLKKKRLLTDSLETSNPKELSAGYQESSPDPAYTVDGIKSAMQDLSDGYRVVLNLYLFEGYDHEEISTILGISTSTSKSQYHRAKKRLKELLVA